MIPLRYSESKYVIRAAAVLTAAFLRAVLRR